MNLLCSTGGTRTCILGYVKMNAGLPLEYYFGKCGKVDQDAIIDIKGAEVVSRSKGVVVHNTQLFMPAGSAVIIQPKKHKNA